MSNIENLLWVEKYRPKTIAECALPERLLKIFNTSIKSNNLNNMTLAGPAGTGKTTAARALANDMGMECLYINASENGNIDTIRTTVRSFGSGMSFTGGKRVVLLDEGDHLTPLAQASLRGMIEELSANCRFIITANFANKIIDPLVSRCPLVDYTYTPDEKIEGIVAADARVRWILEQEGVSIPPEAEEAFSAFMMRHFPDMRTILMILQRSCNDGQIDWANIASSQDLYDYSGLIDVLKAADFNGIRKWVAENVDRDGAGIRRYIFNMLEDVVQPSSMPPIILALAEYDYKESFVIDKEVNTLAMLLSIAAEAEFK